MELALQGGVAGCQFNQVGGVSACGLFAASDLGTQTYASIALGRGLLGAPGGIALVIACDIASGGTGNTDQKRGGNFHAGLSPMHVR
jgi:hypothetical protein